MSRMESIQVGSRVWVANPHPRGGEERYRGREGIVVRKNGIDRSVCYVQLAATRRAASQQALLLESELRLLMESPACPNS